MSTPYGPPSGERGGQEPSSADQQWSAPAGGPADPDRQPTSGTDDPRGGEYRPYGQPSPETRAYGAVDGQQGWGGGQGYQDRAYQEPAYQEPGHQERSDQQDGRGYAPGDGQPGQYGRPGQYGGPGQYGAPAAPGGYGQPGQYGPPGGYGAPGGYGPPGAYAPGTPAPGAYAPGTPAPGVYGQPGTFRQPVPGTPPVAAAPKKQQTGLLIGVAAAVVVLALVAVGLFVWPGPLSSKVLDSTQVARGVEKILTDPAPGGYALENISGASCPTGQEVRRGATFECSVQQDGDTKRVRITVLDEDARYEVAPPQ